jgi:predicted RNA binding protein YcfA (HicA-like mRNA interferase family)
MSKLDKLLLKMRNNPIGWSIEDIERVANNFGFVKRTTSGSHITFYHQKLSNIITIPYKRPIKPIYIKHFLKLLDEVINEK